MIVLRYVYLVALAAWLGGLLVVGGVAAPSAFAALGPAAASRVAAGAVVGELLRRFHLVAYTAGGTMLVTLGAMALIGPRPRPFAARLFVVSAMLALALLSGVLVTGRIHALQREVGGSVSALDQGDPRRVAFGRWHAASTLLLALDAAGALALLYWESRG